MVMLHAFLNAGQRLNGRKTAALSPLHTGRSALPTKDFCRLCENAFFASKEDYKDFSFACAMVLFSPLAEGFLKGLGFPARKGGLRLGVFKTWLCERLADSPARIKGFLQGAGAVAQGHD